MTLARPARSSANASGIDAKISAANAAIVVLIMLPPQDHRHRLGVYRFNDSVRRRRQKTVDQMRAWIVLDFGPRSPLNSVQTPANANKGRSSLRANQTTSFFFVSG